MRKRSLGIGFADTIKHSDLSYKRKRKLYNNCQEISEIIPTSEVEPDVPQASLSNWRSLVLKIGIVLFSAVTIARLFHLQVVEGNTMRDRSDANRLVAKTIHAPRGILYDRNRIPLVHNEPAFVKVSTDSAELIDYEEALQIEATDSANSQIEVQAVRRYPYDELLSHVLGYTSEITKDELNNPKLAKVYTMGDRIGRAGLEQSYETYLRGEDGATFFEVNAMRNTSRTVNTVEPTEGHSLELTLDLNLQKKATEELKAATAKANATSGVLIAQNPKTGGILAMVSTPAYDNNVFSGKLKQKEYEQLLTDPNRPLFNRAISGVYPPGSIYKIVTATAGLLDKKVDAATRIEDTGVMYLGSFSFPNWLWLKRGATEGSLDIVRAMARSNDIFFYKVGEWVGQEYMAKVAKMLSLGKETGIDLPGEVEGLVPTSAWKREVINEPWYPGDTYHMSIGQGYNLTTPIQLVGLTAYVANKGKAYKPYLVEKVLDKNGKTVKSYEQTELIKDVLSIKELNLIREGMKAACTRGGTGWPMFDFGITRFEKSPEATQAAKVKQRIETGCKTGTAEFGNQGKTHAWFTVFAPYENPEIVLTILVEGGGEGSDVAAPVAKNVLEWYFTQKDQQN